MAFTNVQEQNQPKKPQREEWMLLPPTSGLLASMTDPLRKRPSTFSRNNQDVDPDSTVWTETPQEKLQRLADEQAGIKRKKGGKAEEDSEDRARKRIRDDEIRRGVEKHNASVTMLKVFAKRADGQKDTRGKTLLEQHAERDKKGEEPKAIWDHARDMGVTGRLLSEQERGEKIRYVGWFSLQLLAPRSSCGAVLCYAVDAQGRALTIARRRTSTTDSATRSAEHTTCKMHRARTIKSTRETLQKPHFFRLD